MILIEDLVGENHSSSAPDLTEMDPLREEDALDETQLLDSRVCPLTSVAALLFETRVALQIRVGNAALLVVRGLRSFGWSANSPKVGSPLLAFPAVGSIPDRVGGSFHKKIYFFSDAQLTVMGGSAEFYLLDVEGIGEVPPDYSDMGVADVQDRLPTWTSRGRLLQSSSLG